MTDISDDDEFLDPMPIEFICSITQERMIDPVMAMDGKSYERTSIQQWFDGGNRRSPLSGFIIDTLLVPNHDLKARIHQWVDDQRQGRAAKQKLTLLHAELMSALMTTNKDQAFNIVQEVSELITTSTLLIAPNSIDRLKKLLEFSNMMNAPLQTMLTLLFELCKSKINAKQERHRELRLKCQTLEQVQQNLADKREGWSVMTTQYRRELDPSAGKSTAYTLFQGKSVYRIATQMNVLLFSHTLLLLYLTFLCLCLPCNHATTNMARWCNRTNSERKPLPFFGRGFGRNIHTVEGTQRNGEATLLRRRSGV